MGFIHLFFVLAVGILILFAVIIDILDPGRQENIGLNHEKRLAEEDVLTVGSRFQSIFWFVQVTDIHISKFRDKKRGPDIVQFCKDYLHVIKPEFVIATGDLVDAKHADGRGSQQYIEEWQEYHQVLKECNQHSNSQWLDLRGNHDAFNVPDLQGQQNFYRHYSVQGIDHLTSYHYRFLPKYGKYSFIAVDACPDPGPKRPFNFFGQLNDDRVEELVRYAEESKDSNMTIWFGHYPTSLIVQDPPGIRHVMRNGIVYLCGHLHTLGGYVSHMYTRQKTGTLELELADWKDNRVQVVALF